jgi:hypothetical protein
MRAAIGWTANASTATAASSRLRFFILISRSCCSCRSPSTSAWWPGRVFGPQAHAGSPQPLRRRPSVTVSSTCRSGTLVDEDHPGAADLDFERPDDGCRSAITRTRDAPASLNTGLFRPTVSAKGHFGAGEGALPRFGSCRNRGSRAKVIFGSGEGRAPRPL